MTSKVRNVSGGGCFLVKAAGVVASVALALGIGLAAPCTAQAIDLAAPEHSKTISSNDGGTYTLSLDVTGRKGSQSETVTQKTDIVLVMDTSGSMDFRMDKDKNARPGESRLDYAKTAANDLVNSVVKNGNDVRVAVVSFNKDAKTVVGYTSDKGELRRGIDGLWADGGTNWEAGLAAANGLTARDGAKKYIVFLSDGEPTYRYEKHSFLGYSWTEVAGNGRYYEQANFDHAVAEAKKRGNATLFSVAVGSTQKVSERMSSFQKEATGSTDGCYSATTPEALRQAFASITQTITQSAQYTNVTITDALTDYVDFVGADGNVRVSARDAEGNEVSLSPSDYEVSVDAATKRATLRFRQGQNGQAGFVLGEDVTYTLSFDVKLTQAAYDAAAAAGKTTTLPTNAEGKLSYSVVNDNGTTQTVVAGADQSYQPQSVDVPVNVVSIQKTWVGGTVRPDSLAVELLRDGQTYKTVALDAAAGYKADVVVPAGVGDSVWSVSEAKVPAGYTPTYGDAVTNSGTLSITNTYSVSPVKVSLSGHKTLTGRDLKAGEFSFQLKNAQGKVVSTATNDAKGNFAFDDLTFDAAGTYSYTVTEDTSNLPAGVSPVTEGSKSVTIVVTDNGDGTLSADVRKDALEFENSYEAGAAMVQLSFAKTLSGRPTALTDGEFQFQLKDEQGNVVATASNDAAGTVTFPRMAFGEAGTYTYKVSEVVGSAAGITYDADVREVTIKVTDDGKGYLVAKTSVDGKTTFTNAYKAESVSYSVSQDVKVSKTLTGRDFGAGEFEFELVENGNVVATAHNDAEGKVNFDALKYDEAGTHTYVVREAKGSLDGVTYDASEYVVTVSVTDDGSGRLSAKATSADGQIVFKNAYSAAPTSITFGGTKVLTGAELAAGQFAFQLKDAQGNVVATATNAADGSLVFEPVSLDAAGEYHLTLSEVNDAQDNVTYDDHVYQLDVTVADDGEGSLYVASYTVDGGTDLPVFENAYVAPEAPSEPAAPQAPAAVPNTGDATSPVLPLAIGTCALAAACAALLLVRRNNR